MKHGPANTVFTRPRLPTTPRAKALKQKWSANEGASNSTCSPESHEIYALAEDLESELATARERRKAVSLNAEGVIWELHAAEAELAALTARLEAAEGDA